jgi:hypothetical protein
MFFNCICTESGCEVFWDICILSVTLRALNVTLLFIIFMTSATWEMNIADIKSWWNNRRAACVTHL